MDILTSASPISRLQEPIYISHRGEAADAPEGSLPAYQLAIERQLPCIKLDVHYTRDKVIIMSHDESLQRTTGWPGAIKEQDYASLKENAIFNPVNEYSSERIVTFAEALAVVKECPLFYLDFKNDFSLEILEDVLAQCRDFGISRQRLIFPNFIADTLLSIKRAYPALRTLRHISYQRNEQGSYRLPWQDEEVASAALAGNIIKHARELELFGVSLPAHPDKTGPELIAELQANGLWVPVWFVNDDVLAKYFYHAGANAFVSDCGDRVRAVVRREISLLRERKVMTLATKISVNG
ncbi:MAG: glycerophosphodiester phosphodiesterase family protein [Lentisphaeria bacterium]